MLQQVLGQGIAMAVGMAIAERHLAETYNRDSFNVVDHYTYSICGDGDLMEGISSEAASLAGHLQLGRLIVLYDSNDISLDGDLDRSFSENVKQRFEAMNWEVLYVEDGNNIEELTAAIEKARQNEKKPTLIEVKTTIGFGSPNRAGTSGVHGAPLGKEESKLTKEAYAWTYEEDFYVPSEVYEHFAAAVKESGEKKNKNGMLNSLNIKKFILNLLNSLNWQSKESFRRTGIKRFLCMKKEAAWHPVHLPVKFSTDLRKNSFLCRRFC